jgi:hypothetical protein
MLAVGQTGWRYKGYDENAAWHLCGTNWRAREQVSTLFEMTFFDFCIQKCGMYKNCALYSFCLISQKSLRFADVLFEIEDISSGSIYANNVYNFVTAAYYIKDLYCVFCFAINKTTVKNLTRTTFFVLKICFVIKHKFYTTEVFH